jgi:hypothetical protein
MTDFGRRDAGDLKEKGNEWQRVRALRGDCGRLKALLNLLHLKEEEVCLSEVKCKGSGMLLQP